MIFSEQEKEDCWEKDYSNLYLGHIDVTASGRQCQPWASQEPHAHNMIKHFPSNQSMITAKNYCRDPDGEGKPWCYTMDPEVRAEFCNVPLCRSLMPGMVLISNEYILLLDTVLSSYIALSIALRTNPNDNAFFNQIIS